MTKEQKKELIEAGIVVVLAVAVYWFLHHGSTVSAVTPTSIDTTPNYVPATGGDIGSIAYNYPSGGPLNYAGTPLPGSPDVSFGFGGSSFAGDQFGGSPVNDSNTGNTSGFSFGGLTGAGSNSNSCGGCCATTPANGDAFGTPQQFVQMVQNGPPTPTIVAENPYGFEMKDFNGKSYPAHSVTLSNGVQMSLDQYNLYSTQGAPAVDDVGEPTSYNGFLNPPF